MSRENEEAQAGQYKVNPLLVGDYDSLTGIQVRALHPDQGWGQYDVGCLMADDFKLWLTAVDGRPEEVSIKLMDLLLQAKAREDALANQVAKLVEAVDSITGED